MKNRNKIITGLLGGVLIGAIAGLLFAPKTGKETRETVGGRANDWRDRAGDYIGNLSEKIRKGRETETIEEHSENGVQTHR
jgi:gas vesicle protein